jgi:hypothetical protein
MKARRAVLATALLLTLVFIVTPSVSHAQANPKVDPGLRKAVSELLVLIGAESSGEGVAYSIAQETLSSIAATGAPVTETMQQIVVEEALAEFTPIFGDIDYLTDLYAPLYAEHFDEKEIRTVIDFYASPIGRKTAAVLPEIAQSALGEIQKASYARIPDFQKKVDTRLKASGIEIAP